MTAEATRVLAAGVTRLGELSQQHQAELGVIVAALAALVRTHPDPAAFAAAFRRSWQLLGSQHSNAELGPQNEVGIDAVLSILEQECAVPLNVRPGR